MVVKERKDMGALVLFRLKRQAMILLIWRYLEREKLLRRRSIPA